MCAESTCLKFVERVDWSIVDWSATIKEMNAAKAQRLSFDFHEWTNLEEQKVIENYS